jgi:hypothetical protein
MKKVNIDILIGLPGSGKTYYCDDIRKNYNENVMYLDFDELPCVECFKLPQNEINNIFRYNVIDRILVDGLFTTIESQNKIVEKFIELYKQHKNDKRHVAFHFNFIYFNEDREACLHNDSFRPAERSAKISIKNLPLECPNVKNFNNVYGDGFRISFDLKKKDIHNVTGYELFVENNRDDFYSRNTGKNIIVSQDWCLGGTVGCWDGTVYECTPDPQPEDFEEFDKLLSEYAPKISFLEYKKIKKDAVRIEENVEYDYYGGKETRRYYVCDLDVLFGHLVELGYINA